MATKHISLYGTYSAWNFHSTTIDQSLEVSGTTMYHQTTPQLYCPVDQIAPFLVAVAKIPRPVSLAELWRDHADIPVPSGDRTPRFRTAETYNTSNLFTSHNKLVEPIRLVEILVWVYWAEIRLGPYTSSASARGKTRRPAGAAAVWDVVDHPEGVKLGFTAFDKNGQPHPWLTVKPCPPDEFAALIRTDDTLSALAGL